MADAKEELSCPITYEELRDIEKEFEDVETEISKWTLKKAFQYLLIMKMQ